MALSADRIITSRNEGKLTPAKVTGSATIYGGALVQRTTATGLVLDATATTAATFAGVAREKVVGNSAATSQVALYQSGDFEFAIVGAAEGDCGSVAYISDDLTVTTTSTDSLACGKIVEYLSSTSIMLRITGYAF